MTLTVLNVAYPFAPVTPDAVGGAEQIVAALDTGLARAGHHSFVLACEGSRVQGTLIAVPAIAGTLTDAAVSAARERHAQAVRDAMRQRPIDVIHMHGVDFFDYLPPPGVPVLATLHLPIGWYPAEALTPSRPDTWLNCVSASQHDQAPASANLLPAIANGVPVELFDGRHAKRRFALMLGRICPEKGVHVAIDAAKQAGISLLIAGEVFGYEAHQRYFEEEIRPRLDQWRRFIGPVGLKRKRRLLAAARCVLIPSLAEETSSLVAREALAAATPVIAFDRGALREAVDHGRTGYLVHSETKMAEAIGRIEAIDTSLCRKVARERFTSDRMIGEYLAVYQQLAGSQPRQMESVAARNAA